MFYVVSAPDRSSWSFDRGLLIKLLLTDWPGIGISGPHATLEARDVIWAYRDPEGELEGSQDRAGQAQYLEGPLPLVARYVEWWRRQVPAQDPLLLYDETYTTEFSVPPNADAQTILDVLTA